MAAEVTCPNCQHRFSVAPHGPGWPHTCPRCGAPLARTEVRPAQNDVQATPPGPAALATTTCLSCGRRVPELCLLCPHCEEPLAERHRVRRDDAEEERKRVPSGPMLALAAVGVLTVLVLLGMAVGALVTRNPMTAAQRTVTCIVLILIIGAAVGIPLLAGVRPRGRGRWAVFMTDALAGVGCISLVILAVAAFVMVVCSSLL